MVNLLNTLLKGSDIFILFERVSILHDRRRILPNDLEKEEMELYKN